MAENTQNRPTNQFINSLTELSSSMMDIANANTQHNVTVMENVLENSTEVLKSMVKSTCGLMQQQLEQIRKQYSGLQGFELVEKMIETQQRNLGIVQSMLENGIDMLKSQVVFIRSFTQALGRPVEQTQNAVATVGRGVLDNYMNMLFNPFAFYQQGLQAMSSASQQGLKAASSTSLQGLEIFQPTFWWQQMTNQQQKAQSTFQSQAPEAMMSMLFAPLTLYQQMLSTMYNTFQKQVEDWQKITPAGHDNRQEASR